MRAQLAFENAQQGGLLFSFVQVASFGLTEEFSRSH